MSKNPIGILSALPQELEALRSEIQNPKKIEIRGSQFITGTIHSTPIVATLSGMGKVNAASTSQSLISDFHARLLLFTGVAGGLDPALEIGDIVIGDRAFEHDVGFLGEQLTVHRSGVLPEIGIGMGGESIYYELGKWPASYPKNSFERICAHLQAQEKHLIEVAVDLEKHRPKIKIGTIATGDQFIANEAKKKTLTTRYGATAVEMEGGAVAHVANKNGIPCIILRAISDKAGVQAKFDFQKFMGSVAANNAKLVASLLELGI